MLLSRKDETDQLPSKEGAQIMEKKEFMDPELLQIFAHEKNQMILSLLIEKEMTIIDMKNETKLNPGTIKRHLNKLIEKNLIIQSRTETNKYGIKMKFYRATAKQFEINIKFRWPEK